MKKILNKKTLTIPKMDVIIQRMILLISDLLKNKNITEEQKTVLQNLYTICHELIEYSKRNVKNDFASLWSYKRNSRRKTTANITISKLKFIMFKVIYYTKIILN
jgi:hypothetical protein